MINQQNDIYLITGASSGIGKELVLQLVAQNKKVLAVARDKEKLNKLKKYNNKLIEIIDADVGTEEGRKKIINCLSSDVKISALINNAGVMLPTGYLENIDLSEFRYQMATNLEAPLFLTQKLLPYLTGGRVLNVTIYSSFRVSVGLGCYGITKAALNMMSNYYQVELQKYDIAVGNVLPGIVDTNIQNQLPKINDGITDKVNQLKSEGKLLNPKVSAAFLTWLLLNTDKNEFSKRMWDIYDTQHHQYWASSMEIPIIN